VLDQLRETTEPISTRELTKRWIKHYNIEADKDVFRDIRRKIGIGVTSCVSQGLVEAKETVRDPDTGAHSNLWGIRARNQQIKKA